MPTRTPAPLTAPATPRSNRSATRLQPAGRANITHQVMRTRSMTCPLLSCAAMLCSFEHCIDSNTRTLALHTHTLLLRTHTAPTRTHHSFSPTTLFTCSSTGTWSPVSSSSPTVCAHIVAPSVPRDLRPTCWHISARNLERMWASLHTECVLHSKNK